ncbi:hypothetical protein NQ176_g6334 [Zarea fungicola]|uniref:Uncharacterized protein n=1 Tax=Zarea fungicola TaxID=93591 RepID=A0ACC1N5L8_9HYPO|nr:hypothetical protein NQ176_g6334 [Lecanicillium fungicola]
MLCLSTMGYAKTGCLQLLQVFAAFAKIRNLCKVDVPAGHYFSLHQGRAAVRSDILQIVRLHLKEFCDCPESHISRHGRENEYDFNNRRYNEFTANRDSAADRFTTMVYAQWICAKPGLLSVDSTYVDSSAAIQAIGQKWKFCSRDIHGTTHVSIYSSQQPSSNTLGFVSSGWKQPVVALRVAVTKVQRAKRLKQTKLMSDLAKELSNAGHMNWDPLNSPETLLLEIESGILIRDVQEDIALQMRDPPDGKNAVMQLNMAEGKSSVTVPIVAAHLADGSRLGRVIVAKPRGLPSVDSATETRAHPR